MRCSEVQDLLPLYIAGALDSRTRQRVEEHLARCPECDAESREGLETTARLALAVPQVPPPTHLKQRLLTRLPHTPSSLGAPLPRWATPAFLGAVFTALLVLISLGMALVWQVRTQRREITHLQTMVQEQRALIYMLALPERTVVLAQGTESAPRAWGVVLASPDGRSGLLVAVGLPPLPPDKTYQVWLIREGERVNGGIFQVDERGWGQVSLWVQEPLWGFQWLGVTMEPQPGSPDPTGPRVLLVELPRPGENR